jgi:Flp pilus assembly protein TadD
VTARSIRFLLRPLGVLLCLQIGLLLAGCSGSLAQVGAKLKQDFEAQRSYEDGLAKFRAADYRGAIPLFKAAVELDPELDDAAADLAWSYYHTGNYTEATRYFRQTILRQPKWEGLHDGLGWSRYRVKRYHLALESFREALALDPKYRDAAVGYAYSLFELGRYAEALPHLERLTREGEATAFRPASSDVEEVRSKFAWTLFYLADYRRARAEFTKGIAARPDWAGLYNGLGWTDLRLGDRVQARANFERALRLQPRFEDAREGLAMVKP